MSTSTLDQHETALLYLYVIQSISCVQVDASRFLVDGNDRKAHIHAPTKFPFDILRQKSNLEKNVFLNFSTVKRVKVTILELKCNAYMQ